MAAAYDICIVGLKCWGFISGAERPRYIGGIESDFATLARVLADAGKRVALIVYDEGQPAVSEIDGVTVVRSFSPDAGLPGLRFIAPRATGLIRAIRRIDAPYVIQMGAGVETGWTGIAAKWLGRGRRFVFFVGGDRDCLAGLPAIRHGRERLLYRLGLKLADRIVTQTAAQAGLLRDNFGLDSEVLRLPNALQAEAANGEPAAPGPGSAARRILWVGRIDRNKRPHWLLALAAAYPDYAFDVVGEANTDGDYAAEFRRSAAAAANIAVHGKVPRHRIAAFYRSADVLCCTSEFEGFPATFLEAWSFGLPTVSTVDPGGFVSTRGAGTVVSSLDDLRAALAPDRLQASLAGWSERARELYAGEFSPAACLQRFNDVLRKVA